MKELPASAAWAADAGTSLCDPTGVGSAQPDAAEPPMADIETPAGGANRYIIKRPRLTRLLDGADARVLMLVAPAGYGKTTLAREWMIERRHAWYRCPPAAADVAALVSGLAKAISPILPDVGANALGRMRAGSPADGGKTTRVALGVLRH